MNKKEIEEMIKLMNENKLTELEIEKNGLKIKLKKEGSGFKKEGKIETIGIQEEKELQKANEKIAKKQNVIEIKSPMVGTFYGAPSPEEPSFTDVGKEVKPGDIVCIIEAMKLMNEIKSEVKGKIVEVTCENGAPVEYGQILFKVELEI